jgi:hypothetical protein
MTDSFTPPPELVGQWQDESPATQISNHIQYLATRAAQWGANQQLETCCEQLKSIPSPLGIPFGEMASNALRSVCRPKPPSLKEQALHELVDAYDKDKIDDTTYDTIRAALLALPND